MYRLLDNDVLVSLHGSCGYTHIFFFPSSFNYVYSNVVLKGHFSMQFYYVGLY